MVLKNVVAGTNSWFSKPIHLLLLDSVKAQWAATITDPQLLTATFNDTWFTDSQDIEFTFKPLREYLPPEMRDNAWTRKRQFVFVDVHLWIRGGTTGTGEPTWAHGARTAFENIIDIGEKTILPNTVVTIDHIDPVEDRDHLASTLHYVYSLTVTFEKVKADV